MKTYQINDKIEFAGKLDFLKLPANNIFAMEKEDFVISLRLYRTGVNTISSNYPMYLIDNRGSDVGFSVIYDCSVSKIKFLVDNTECIITKASIPTNKWFDLSLVRKKNITSLFVNGQLSGNVFYDVNNYKNNIMYLGCRYESINNDSRTWYGYISNLNIIKGVGFYPS